MFKKKEIKKLQEQVEALKEHLGVEEKEYAELKEMMSVDFGGVHCWTEPVKKIKMIKKR